MIRDSGLRNILVSLRGHGGLHATGEHCALQTSLVISDPACTRLGHNSSLSGCTLSVHDGVVNMLRNAHGGELDRIGCIDIRDNVFIGHQAIVLPDVTIGPDAILAPGSVVTRDVRRAAMSVACRPTSSPAPETCKQALRRRLGRCPGGPDRPARRPRAPAAPNCRPGACDTSSTTSKESAMWLETYLRADASGSTTLDHQRQLARLSERAAVPRVAAGRRTA